MQVCTKSQTHEIYYVYTCTTHTHTHMSIHMHVQAMIAGSHVACVHTNSLLSGYALGH